jgi:hypothetical protein
MKLGIGIDGFFKHLAAVADQSEQKDAGPERERSPPTGSPFPLRCRRVRQDRIIEAAS